MIRQTLLKTSPNHVLAAQAAILQHFVNKPLAQVSTTLESSGFVINSVDSSPSSSSESGGRTLVLAHGLGSGCGFFFSNYGPLLRSSGGSYDRIIGIDWLGFGASSRPYLLAPRHKWWSSTGMCRSCFDDAQDADGESTGALAAADFFVDSFEEWRATLGLEKFTLVRICRRQHFTLLCLVFIITPCNRLLPHNACVQLIFCNISGRPLPGRPSSRRVCSQAPVSHRRSRPCLASGLDTASSTWAYRRRRRRWRRLRWGSRCHAIGTGGGSARDEPRARRRALAVPAARRRLERQHHAGPALPGLELPRRGGRGRRGVDHPPPLWEPLARARDESHCELPLPHHCSAGIWGIRHELAHGA